MTDNRTTELLRLLDERGVKYELRDFLAIECVVWNGNACRWAALPDEKGLAVTVYKDYLTPEQAIAATLGRPRATSNQESIVRSFLRKISPNRDWDYLGEHEHAMIADFVDGIAATLGSEREEALEELVQDVWRAYSAKAESSFHPAWEVDSELENRIKTLGIEVSDDDR